MEQKQKLRENRFWPGGDLQTLRYGLFYIKKTISGTQTPCRFPVNDGTGDILTGTLHHPERPRRAPLVVLLHGLGGSEDSAYMWSTCRFLMEQGISVLRLNLRGAGSSSTSCRLSYHAGSKEDIFPVLAQIPAELASNGIFMVGYSLGGSLLLNVLAALGPRTPVVGAVAVSAPLSMVECSARMSRRRNRAYELYLLRDLVRQESGLRQRHGDKGTIAFGEIASLREFDDKVTAPKHGFEDAMDYYHKVSGEALLSKIRVPLCLLQADNDPWICSNAYRRVASQAHPGTSVLLTPGGGHVGFHFQGNKEPFYNRLILHCVLKSCLPSKYLQTEAS